MAKRKSSGTDTAVPMSAAMIAVSPVTTKAWLALTNECTRFAMDRLQHDLEAQRAMLACKTPADFMQQQFGYYQEVTQQYAKQTTRLFQMFADTAQQASTEATSGHSRKYDDIPL